MPSVFNPLMQRKREEFRKQPMTNGGDTEKPCSCGMYVCRLSGEGGCLQSSLHFEEHIRRVVTADGVYMIINKISGFIYCSSCLYQHQHSNIPTGHGAVIMTRFQCTVARVRLKG